MRFEGRRVLVAGGTGYLGTEIVRGFHDEGAVVGATWLFDEEIPRFETTLGPASTSVILIQADVTKEDQVARAVATFVDQARGLDVLVNVVGGWVGAGDVETLSWKDWSFALDLNLNSAFLVSRAAIPHLKKAKPGKVVSISSRSGLRGEGEAAAYSVAKSGVIRLTEALAEELLEDDVQVNCILPSVLDTPANREAMGDADAPTWVPLEAASQLVRFLASRDADHISGAAIPIFGRA